MGAILSTLLDSIDLSRALHVWRAAEKGHDVMATQPKVDDQYVSVSHRVVLLFVYY
jgi:hypothetical protein